jgi:hypothetical protein
MRPVVEDTPRVLGCRMELSRGAQQEGGLANQADHSPFTRLERRKSLIERGCFSHVLEHKAN